MYNRGDVVLLVSGLSAVIQYCNYNEAEYRVLYANNEEEVVSEGGIQDKITDIEDLINLHIMSLRMRHSDSDCVETFAVKLQAFAYSGAAIKITREVAADQYGHRKVEANTFALAQDTFLRRVAEDKALAPKMLTAS